MKKTFNSTNDISVLILLAKCYTSLASVGFMGNLIWLLWMPNMPSFSLFSGSFCDHFLRGCGEGWLSWISCVFAKKASAGRGIMSRGLLRWKTEKWYKVLS